jgi:hypothetical protein
MLDDLPIFLKYETRDTIKKKLRSLQPLLKTLFFRYLNRLYNNGSKYLNTVLTITL